VQFHPTALAPWAGAAEATAGTAPEVAAATAGAVPEAMPLLTEALRGEGALLVDETGSRFCDELAARDVVARAIYAHLAAGHRTFLDARALGEQLPEQFPTVFAHCRRAGIDPRRAPIPVSPAAHYCMGGLVADVFGRTVLPGLWAAGEVTATGLHGANRLASNSLLEGIVMGRNAGLDIRRRLAAGMRSPERRSGTVIGVAAAALVQRGDDPAGIVAEVRRLLWRRVGLVREADGLREASRVLEGLAQRAADTNSGPGRNAVEVARLVVTSASGRQESRGAHQRSDFPTAAAAARVRRTVTPVPAPLASLALGRAVAA
jgi:L-aspartate oxidase